MKIDDPDPQLMVLGANIRALRLAAGETQAQAAAACGFGSRTFWTYLENGRSNVGVRKLLNVAAHYKVAVADLFGGL